MKIATLIAALWLALPAVAADKLYWVEGGFITGNKYRAMDEAVQQLYVAGLSDGLQLAVTFGAPQARVDWYDNCTKRMVPTQLHAIFNIYLDKNPGEWHSGANMLFRTAIHESCRSRGYK